MIKLITIVFILLSIEIKSQLNFGISGGINYGNIINTYDAEKYDELISYKGGILVSYQLAKFDIKSGFYISQRGGCKGYSFLPKNQKLPLRSTFFEIPLIISKSIISDKFYVGLGIINAINKGRGEHLIDDKPFEIDLQLLLSYKLTKRIEIDLSYLFGGVSNYFKNRDTHLYSVGNLSINYYIKSIKFK